MIHYLLQHYVVTIISFRNTGFVLLKDISMSWCFNVT